MRDINPIVLAEIERRIEKLEQQNARLREFIIPAYWRTIDKLDERAADPITVACLACGREADPMTFRTHIDECMFGGGRLERYECPDCDCIFGPTKYLQTPANLVAADYSLLYSFYSEGDSTENELRAFELLEPRRDGIYLNWGSGAWSQSVDLLRSQGYDVWGYEPNAESSSPFVVRQRGEISTKFDGIFSNNVIEHLFSPLDQFREFRDLLKPGAKMVHASPCYEWSYAFTRFHVFFPIGRASQRLAKRSGFEMTNAVDQGDFLARVFTDYSAATERMNKARLTD